METVDLKLQTRKDTGKGPAGRVRRAGGVPGVVYGKGIEPTAIAVAAEHYRHFNSLIGHNVFLKLDIEGPLAGKMSLVTDWQRDPMKGRLLHVDLLVIDMSKPIVVELPVVLTGKAKGQKEGGIVNVLRREIEIRCLPSALPDSVEFDISEMEIGAVLHIADLTLPEGVEAIYDVNYTIMTVNAPAAEEEEKPAEGEEGLEAAEGEGAEGEEGAEKKEGEGAEASDAKSDDKKDKKDKKG